MNDQSPPTSRAARATTTHETARAAGLALLREPFPPHQISKLPKPTRQQTEEVRADFKKGIRCGVCGIWHHPKVVHLDYVGHAALTDRLLECDPEWNWEPVATDEHGRPVFDANGGMWIRLTVCGLTRLGYGHPDGKTGGDAIKEVIGDALRNAALRFGAALDLWHKGDLHGSDNQEPVRETPKTTDDTPTPRQLADRILTSIRKAAGDKAALTDLWARSKDARSGLPDELRDEVKSAFADAAPKESNPIITDDEIPY